MHALDKGRGILAAREARPLHALKGFRDIGRRFRCLVQRHRHNERLVARNHLRTRISERPFEPEIAFCPGGGVCRYQRYEEGAVANFLADVLVPGVSATKLATIEPDLDAGSAQGIAKAMSSLRILRRVAQEHRSGRINHDAALRNASNAYQMPPRATVIAS